MRAFIAAEITDAGVLDSIARMQSEMKIAAKPVELQNMHFTLLFLGEIPDDVAGKVVAQLEGMEFLPFEVSFEGTGAFPKPRSPRVIWIGVKDGRDQIIQLAKNVEERLAPLGFSADKPFKPHITIFRIKNGSSDITEQLSKYSSTRFGRQLISEIKLKRSVLTPQGPVYSDVGVVTAR